MQLLNLTLSYLLQEIKPLIEGSYINRIQELSAEKFRFRLRAKEGTKSLLVFPNALFFSEYKLDALKQTSGFGAFLRKRIEGKKILSVKQHNSDRIIEFELDECFLILEFFFNGNIILTDKNHEIISALRKEESKNRKISKNEKYFFPESDRLDPKEMSFDNFKQDYEKSFKEKNNPVLSVISVLDIAPIFAEEVFFRLKLKKEKISEEELKKVFEEIKKIYSLKEKPNPIEIQKGAEIIIIPFKLPSIKKFRELNSINSCLDDFYSKDFFSERIPEKKPKQLIALEHSHKEQLNSGKRLEEEIELNKKKAEKIYSNNLIVQEMINSIKKGFSKGLTDKEIMEKINAFLKQNNKEIELLSLTKNKALLSFKEN